MSSSRGADPNAREAGDNVTPLHLAAANGHLESVRLLLDAGADVHGLGDAHDGGVIGWAAGSGNQAVIDLLMARGARHHVFSAIALRDKELLRRVVSVIRRPCGAAGRASRTARRRSTPRSLRLTASGASPARPTTTCSRCSIDLGADVDATDDRGARRSTSRCSVAT